MAEQAPRFCAGVTSSARGVWYAGAAAHSATAYDFHDAIVLSFDGEGRNTDARKTHTVNLATAKALHAKLSEAIRHVEAYNAI